jgi:hypothetical protein
VWAEAAKWLAKFDEAVLTVLDADGYPVSIRVDTRNYDAATGQLPAELVGQLGCAEGPANLLCHYHDEKMWNIRLFRSRVVSRSETAAGCSKALCSMRHRN